MLCILALLLGAAFPAQADNCSAFPDGVLDGFAGDIAPSQIFIDRDCTIRNFPASNPLNTNFSFKTQPGQTDERWLVIFDNVVHNGQMACNIVAGHIIWFTNGSSTQIQEDCQNLLIPVEKIDKQNPAGQTTAAIGVPFTYTLTMPVLFDAGTGTVINEFGSLNDLHSIRLTDNLNETGADLTYVSHVAYFESSGAPVPHTFSNVGGLLTFENFPIVLAGEQIIIEITVVLDDSPANTVGTQFINTAKWEFGRLIDGVFFSPLPGEWGITPPLTIAAPALVFTKTGPATLNLGASGDFTLDIQNSGTTDAWNTTIVDRLPDGASGGMCDTTPTVLSAQVFAADGVTPVPGKGALSAGDYSLSYVGAPTCELTLTMVSSEAAIGPNERLIISYRTQLDADTQDSAVLTNVAGATEWFNGDASNPDRTAFVRVLTNGTVGTLDHEDAHTVTTALTGFFFEKSVENLTSGANPASTAAPGDSLRYSLRLQTTDSALNGLTFFDDLGALNATAVFESGTLALVASSIPPGADTSNTDPNGGTNGAGIVDIRNLNLPATSEILIQFDITVALGLADGVVLTNQADLLNPVQIADSDDPNINGQADPNVVGDEDPTRIVIASVPAPPLIKANTQATASVGEQFRYRITVPETPHPFDLYDVQITDDLTASAADLRFVDVTKISGSGAWTPVNTGTTTNPVIEDSTIGIDIPAGEQVVIEVTVVLEDTPTNITGLVFTNTASYVYNLINDIDANQQPGLPGTTGPMTIVGPDDITVVKSGPVAMAVGTPGVFTLNAQNTGTAAAWSLQLADQLPDGATGGICDVAPTVLSMQVFQADGTTPVSGLLAQGTDYSVGFQPAPNCEFDITMLSVAGVVGPTERLIVSYEAQLDADTQDGVLLTNVAGAIEWSSGDSTDPVTGGDVRTFMRVLTDGTVGTLDHEDAHSVATSLPEIIFEKTVVNVTTGESPATSANPGDTLRYTLRVENQTTTGPVDFALFDELDALNPSAVFEPGTLVVGSAPAGADTSPTNSFGGTAGTGILDVRGLGLVNLGDVVVVEFEVQLASVLPTGTLATNQSELRIAGAPFALSDDPVRNGPADPLVAGDEDPTVVPIVSVAVFQTLKTSTYLDGDPNLLLAGERLRYTITVENIGTADATDATLRDAIPVNTTYIAGTTTLNGVVIADGAGGLSPLATGVPINAPSDPTPGSLAAGGGAIATLTFDVLVDPAAADGTVISNQAFVSAVTSGAVDQPSDDPGTSTLNDPTRDVVGNAPLLFASKQVVIGVDATTPGQVDPGDTLHYTITISNDGTVLAMAAMIVDAVPANTTWVADSLLLNGLPVGVPDGGISPLAAGIPIASSDQTPPLPPPGGGVLTPGESAVVEFDLLVNAGVAPGTLISNQAVVTTAEVPNLPTDGDGNPSTGPEPTVVIVGDAQALAITKSVSIVGGGAALAGSQLAYEVRVTNVATVDAQSVVITDDLDAPFPGQLTLVPGSATLDGVAAGISVLGSVITADWSTLYGALPPGASAVLRFRADIDGGLAIGTTIINTGIVSWNTPPQTASASVSIAIGGIPGVGALNGAIWHDADFDRIQGGTERILAGWFVDLLRNGQLAQAVVTDASGVYRMTGIAPNDLNGDIYELRFRAPDAGANTAALGRAESAFTNGLQSISALSIGEGSNLQGLNLPIDPQGVVYESLLRTPLSGATLSLLEATSQTAVPATCFDDPNQQGQVTGSNGYYKFHLNFSNASCQPGDVYLIAVVPPGTGFTAGTSQIIPPPAAENAASPFDVPACPGGGSDAIPATGQHCEIQISEFAPPSTASTGYHLYVRLDDSLGAGSSQAFNNHIPIDPVFGGSVSITKTTPAINVSRGDLVPYEITFRNQLSIQLSDLSLRDTLPGGFRYIKGSARVDGVPSEPTRNGRVLEWDFPVVDALSSRTVVLLLGVGAGVTEGEFVNRASVIRTDPVSNVETLFSGEATATVRVVPDPTFDCTDVIGKVFDDKNRDGVQDEGEDGLPGVRLMTVRGLAVNTDPHGRFHITCAIVPNEERGSNFVLKLDDRTLPSGYRMSTRQTQVKRATRGKALRFQFGASINRVVGLDLADAVFEPGSVEMRVQWMPRLTILLDELEKSESILRLSYVADIEDPQLVEQRLESVKQQILEAWKSRGGKPLSVETEIYWRRGSPVEVPPHERETSLLQSLLPPVGAGPPGFDASSGQSRERHFPIELEPTKWTVDPELLEAQLSDRLEEREVLTEKIDTIKLKQVVPPIRFESGVADISPGYVAKLRTVLDNMQDLDNVRLHLVGHADDQALSTELSSRFGDNEGLSRERAGYVAEYLQAALSLPPESISYAWAGDAQPIASNATPEGRALNRRVEVEVWYDEIGEEVVFKEVVIPEEIKRFKVCRTETVCKLRYREGNERRARVKNLIPPLDYDDEVLDIPDSFVRQIEEALSNLRDKQNVTAKFIAHTDDVPLTGRAARIYGTHLSISKARARRVALEVKDVLDLPTAAIASEGRGASRPVASNATPRGRALNRRIEVEFWYDDPLLELSDELQVCPDAADAETVTRIYDPPWGRFEALQIEDGEALIPSDFAANLRRAMDDVKDRDHVRLRFIGYTRNERLTRRMAKAYTDDIGLSAARARRTMERIQAQLELTDDQVEHEGRGFVHSEDVVNGGFLQGDTSHVIVQVVYDELAVMDDYDGIEVTPITRELRARDPLSLNLMRITVDGEPIDDPGRSSADIQRCTDVALEDTAISFRFDDLQSQRRLSVSSAPGSVRAGGAEPVRFRMYSNYPHFIVRAEVRIFDADDSVRAEPLAIAKIDRRGFAKWQPPAADVASPEKPLKFVLRAYGDDGVFDETAPQALWMTPNGAGDPLESSNAEGDELLAGYGESEPTVQNIPVGNTGAVRVGGSGIPPDHTVWLAGTELPVDAEGNFVGEVLLPEGLHTVEVAVLDSEGNGELFLRDLELKRDDWFFVGIADLTLSMDLSGNRPNELEGNNSTDLDAFADGRLAFFTKGKFGDDWKLTASADTREGPIESLFTNFLDKSPDALFRRLDPDYHYPTFGDDSSIDEMTPTNGKFYVKLNKGDDHLMWGNFTVRYTDNELALVERGLYGAKARYQSEATTAFGERRVVIDAFAADPGTVSSREEFRGTGGSVYFLKRQDLLIGSERLRIEVRDKDSGLVSEVVQLQPELDYDIDYIQGRVLLSEPISAIANDRLLVRSDGLSGNEVWLVAQYEFTPGFDSVDTLNTGGQGHVWLNDYAKLGVTANNNGGDADSSLYAADLTLRKSTGSWLKVQAGRSDGLVSTTLRSDDGGFDFDAPLIAQSKKQNAYAYRADLSLGLGDWWGSAKGQLTLYGQHLDAGYSAPGLETPTDTDQYGGVLRVPVTTGIDVVAKADRVVQDQGLETLAAEVNVSYQLSDLWSLQVGARYDERDDNSNVVVATQDEGDRTDAVVQLDFDTKTGFRTYAFGQATVQSTRDREENNRGGIGGAYRVNEKISVDGEVSQGNLGTAAQLGATYQHNERSKLYVNYALDDERGYDGRRDRRGSVTVGSRSRLSDSASVYAENQYQHGSVTGLTRSVGITYAPNKILNLGFNWEDGELHDRQTQAETERRAGSFRAGFNFKDLSVSTGIEYIFNDTEQSDGSKSERTTWLFRNSLNFQMNEDGRLMLKFNHAMSDSSEGDFFDGGFTEAVLGYAYRPIAYDRFNALVKYTYFYNVPTVDQVGQDGTSSQFIQKSHVASIDLTYDLTRAWTIGGKYAYRLSQISLDRENTNFFDNDAHLYILRADWRFHTKWEGVLEGRMLDLPDQDERRAGALVTFYRYFGDHFKVGIGYNFTDFSEDLTDLSYDHHGVFFNVLGTF